MTRGFSPKPRISFGPALGLGVPSLGELIDVDLEHGVPGADVGSADGAERVELSPTRSAIGSRRCARPASRSQSCTIVRLAGHPLVRREQVKPEPGLGKLIDAVDVVIAPAPDGMAYDAARLERIARRVPREGRGAASRAARSRSTCARWCSSST